MKKKKIKRTVRYILEVEYATQWQYELKEGALILMLQVWVGFLEAGHMKNKLLKIEQVDL